MRLVPFAEACKRVGMTPGSVKQRLQGRTHVAPPFIPVRDAAGHLYVHERDIDAHINSLPRIDEPRITDDTLFSKPRKGGR